MQRRLAQIDGSIARYLSQLDSADRQGDKVPEAKITRLNEKIATLRQEIQRLNTLNTQMMQTEDKQISLTDPDASSMATSDTTLPVAQVALMLGYSEVSGLPVRLSAAWRAVLVLGALQEAPELRAPKERQRTVSQLKTGLALVS